MSGEEIPKGARYYINTAPRGSPFSRKKYFKTHEEAKAWIKENIKDPKAHYNIHPVDFSGFAKPARRERRSFYPKEGQR